MDKSDWTHKLESCTMVADAEMLFDQSVVSLSHPEAEELMDKEDGIILGLFTSGYEKRLLLFEMLFPGKPYLGRYAVVAEYERLRSAEVARSFLAARVDYQFPTSVRSAEVDCPDLVIKQSESGVRGSLAFLGRTTEFRVVRVIGVLDFRSVEVVIDPCCYICSLPVGEMTYTQLRISLWMKDRLMCQACVGTMVREDEVPF